MSAGQSDCSPQTDAAQIIAPPGGVQPVDGESSAHANPAASPLPFAAPCSPTSVEMHVTEPKALPAIATSPAASTAPQSAVERSAASKPANTVPLRSPAEGARPRGRASVAKFAPGRRGKAEAKTALESGKQGFAKFAPAKRGKAEEKGIAEVGKHGIPNCVLDNSVAALQSSSECSSAKHPQSNVSQSGKGFVLSYAYIAKRQAFSPPPEATLGDGSKQARIDATSTDRGLLESSSSCRADPPDSQSVVPDERAELHKKHRFLAPELWEDQECKEQEERLRSPHLFDCEGRRYDMSRIVVNFNNVGTCFGREVLKNGAKFNWEGVRRCLKYFKEELNVKMIGVIFENWKADDAHGKTVCGVPKDIAHMCEHVAQTPRLTGQHQRSADDEMTIKYAYQRNCRFLDNDNYRDWRERMRNQKVKAWLEHVQERLHMKYYFDAGLGCFELLEGNSHLEVAPDAKTQRASHSRVEMGASQRQRANHSRAESSASQRTNQQIGQNQRANQQVGQKAARNAAPSMQTIRGIPKAPPLELPLPASREDLPLSSRQHVEAPGDGSSREFVYPPAFGTHPPPAPTLGLNPAPVPTIGYTGPLRAPTYTPSAGFVGAPGNFGMPQGSHGLALLPTDAGFRVPIRPTIERVPDLVSRPLEARGVRVGHEPLLASSSSASSRCGSHNLCVRTSLSTAGRSSHHAEQIPQCRSSRQASVCEEVVFVEPSGAQERRCAAQSPLHESRRQSPERLRQRIADLRRRLDPKPRGLAAAPAAADPYGGGNVNMPLASAASDADAMARRKRKAESADAVTKKLAPCGAIDLTDEPAQEVVDAGRTTVSDGSARDSVDACELSIAHPPDLSGVAQASNLGASAVAASVGRRTPLIAEADPYM